MAIRRPVWLALFALVLGARFAAPVSAQEAAAPAAEEAAEGEGPARGSIMEDRAARKLLEAGDARFDADETDKAVEIWESVVERYPRSRVRFDAHMRLGEYFLTRERAYDRARVHFEAVIAEENRDQEQRAAGMLKLGVSYFESRDFGKCFQVMRDVIEQFPVSPQVNDAYYYIGLGHFQLGHYSRAIDALEKVGTALTSDEGGTEKVEAGKRLFIKIDDADLAALESGTAVTVRCETSRGDVEDVECFSVGRNVRLVLGSILTQLGEPQPANGRLEVQGGDTVKVTYVDQHTADRQFNRTLQEEIIVVGDALVQITDGAYAESLQGVALDRDVNLQVMDADRDVSPEADSLTATVEVYRQKTQAEIDEETAALAAGEAAPAEGAEELSLELPQIDPWKLIDSVTVTLTEAKVQRTLTTLATEEEAAAAPGAAPPAAGAPPAGGPAASVPGAAPAAPAEGPAPAASGAAPAAESPPAPRTIEVAEPDDGTIHSGVFRGVVALVKTETPVADDDRLQALPTDRVRIVYADELNVGAAPTDRSATARVVEGNIGGVRVTQAEISDRELRIQTQLRTAGALTNIGNRYKEFGLQRNALLKYEQALSVCESIMDEARLLGGKFLEESYVQLWEIYFAMDRLDMAAYMCQLLQNEFPTSSFVDDAMLQMADVVRVQGDLQRAIGIYSQLAAMPNSELRGDAQFGIAECYEAMAGQSTGPAAAQLFDRAFQEYKKVFDSFPESGRVGEAVAKMANYYYQQKDFSRAIDVFETVLNDYPDAKFLDVILFNYGRCLYRMERKSEARRQFDQLIAEFPESTLAADAKRISEALARQGF